MKALSNTAADEEGCPSSSKADAVTPEPFLGVNFISIVFGSPSFSWVKVAPLFRMTLVIPVELSVRLFEVAKSVLLGAEIIE